MYDERLIKDLKINAESRKCSEVAKEYLELAESIFNRCEEGAPRTAALYWLLESCTALDGKSRFDRDAR